MSNHCVYDVLSSGDKDKKIWHCLAHFAGALLVGSIKNNTKALNSRLKTEKDARGAARPMIEGYQHVRINLR